MSLYKNHLVSNHFRKVKWHFNQGFKSKRVFKVTDPLNMIPHNLHTLSPSLGESKASKLSSLLNTLQTQKVSLTEKPVDLLFSLDQFVFEFSKKTYHQKKTGEFSHQLKERKKLSFFYGALTRKDISSVFEKAAKFKGSFSKNLFSLLERRLDVALYRSGWAQTLAQARQFIQHNKVRVNDSRVTFSSYSLQAGDVISLESKTQQNHTLSALKTQKSLKQDESHFQFQKVKKKSQTQKNKQNKQNNQHPLCDVFVWCILNRIKARCFLSLISESRLALKWKCSENLKSTKKKTRDQKSLENFWKQSSSQSRDSSFSSLSPFSSQSHSLNPLKTCLFLFLKSISICHKFHGVGVLQCNRSFSQKSSHQTQRLLRWRPSKPLHLETSYSLFTSIFLFTPQRLCFPFSLDLDLIKRSLRSH